MVVGIGGIGQIRDPGDPYDPRRGTSVPLITGGFDFEAWQRRQNGEPDPTAVATDNPAFDAFAQELAAGQPQSDATQVQRDVREQYVDQEQARDVARQESEYQFVKELNTHTLNVQAEQISRAVGHFVRKEDAARVVTLLNSGLNIDLPTAVAAVESNGRSSNQLASLFRAQNQASEPEAIASRDARIIKELGLELSREQFGDERAGVAPAMATPDGSDFEIRQAEQETNYAARQKSATQLDRVGTREADASDGKGKRINGRANPFQKEGSGPQMPFTVPVIVGDPGQGRSGTTTQVVTTGFEGRRPTTVMDTSNSRVVLLNPAAELPADFANSAGYTTARVKEQDQTGSYSKTPDVPTNDPALYVYDDNGNRIDTGLPAREDPSFTRRTPSGSGIVGENGARPVSVTNSSPKYVDSRPMTLGQAVQKLLADNVTPISTLRDEDVVFVDANSGSSLQPGVYTKNPDGSPRTQLFEVKNQRDSDVAAGMTAYRVGESGMYSRDMYRQAQELIQQATGGRPVVDPIQDGEAALDFELMDDAGREASIKERTRTVGGVRPVVGEKIAMYDTPVRNQQAQVLLDSFTPEMLGGYFDDFVPEGVTTNRQGLKDTVRPSVTGDSKNAYMAMLSMLAKGAGLPIARGAGVMTDAPAARDTSNVFGPTAPGRVGPSPRPAATSIPQETAASFPPGSLDQLQAELEELGGVRRAEATSNKVSQRGNWKKELPRAAKQNQKAVAATEQGKALAAEQFQRDIAQAAQSETVLRQNAIAEANYQEKLADTAAATSEQNTRQPQAVEEGVMNTDQVSQLNAPAPPQMQDEPTPRMQQIAASSQSQATNAVADDRAGSILRKFMGRVRRNPLRSVGAAAAGGLAALGAAPYDPREGE